MPCNDADLIADEFARQFTQTGQCYRADKKGDGQGGYDISAGYVSTGGSFACVAFPRKKAGDMAEIEQGGHVASVVPWELLTPLTTLLQLRDRVLVDGTRWLEVTSNDKGSFGQYFYTYTCVTVEGALDG